MIYKPMFGHNWYIEEIDENQLRLVTKNVVCRHKPRIGFYGTLYNADNFFKTPEAARAWIAEEYVDPELFYTDFKAVER